MLTAAGALVTVFSASDFTLAWTHSIEKTRWEEDYAIRDAHLHLVEARIAGSGAGMEPPPGARLRNGVWVYRPKVPPLLNLRLARAGVTADYEVCVDGQCRALGALLPDPNVKLAVLAPCAG